jgi:hypothetical protein
LVWVTQKSNSIQFFFQDLCLGVLRPNSSFLLFYFLFFIIIFFFSGPTRLVDPFCKTQFSCEFQLKSHFFFKTNAKSLIKWNFDMHKKLDYAAMLKKKKNETKLNVFKLLQHVLHRTIWKRIKGLFSKGEEILPLPFYFFSKLINFKIF